MLGITQEQHPERCRLFAQWKKFDWPILHDPINVLQPLAVPILVAIDEHGVVRSTRPEAETFEAEFLDRTFSPPAGVAEKPAEARLPDLQSLRREALQSRSAVAWRRLGDATVLWAPTEKINDAIDAYMRAVRLAPDDGDAHFRLGVCYRMRYESSQRVATDFQSAVDQWTRAREIEPNQYIWRRRIEQYGPRLIKPYPFYDWVSEATDQIAARGEKPVALRVELSGAEIAHPSRTFVAEGGSVKSPDPTGRILRDTGRLIVAEVAVVPPRIKPGESARVHVTMRPSDAETAHWNNEAEPLRLWIDTPDGWQLQQQLLTAPQGNKPETAEPRHFEFEVRAAANARGPTQLGAYALYYICEEVGGMCLFRRQDIPITVTVDE
ncbi:MAG: hypothetical protein V3R99_09255 [Thermoguttaceae bacterium]